MPSNKKGQDAKFLLESSFSRDSGICPKACYRNAAPAVLYEQALLHEPAAHVVNSGALAVSSGPQTGRCPQAKHVVREEGFEGQVWWGVASPNHAMEDSAFLANRQAAVSFLNAAGRLFVVDGFACWEPACRMKVRLITSLAQHALFATNMLIRPTPQQLAEFGEPDFVVYNAGACPAPESDEAGAAASATSIDLSLSRREMVILGTRYAGEMKKGVFMLLHYFLPQRSVLFLHSGCSVGQGGGDVTLFLGLSGTGKTTLSTDPSRPFIGDDELCWGPSGVFNIEGGCYAKALGLSGASQPAIHNAIRFGTLLENVCFDPESREVDWDDASITENTRACYPISHIANARIPCTAGHPSNIILLCCDAFGVLPPVSRLSQAQALYHFVSGYTAKVAGTETGVVEPRATFSPCYAGAFLMWHPLAYAALLAGKMQAAGCQAWLVNTGWCGGSAGGGGSRISLAHTRAIVAAIHSGELPAAACVETPVFRLQMGRRGLSLALQLAPWWLAAAAAAAGQVPVACSGVPSQLLLPELQWHSSSEFGATLSHLAVMFAANFQQYADGGGGVVGQELLAHILRGGPQQQQQQQQQQQGPGVTPSEAATGDALPQEQQRQAKQGHCCCSSGHAGAQPLCKGQAPAAAAAAPPLANFKGALQQQQLSVNGDTVKALR
ncbi:hypothetical protein OEZ86_002155 [Tetradesmus obliquus]|nr:hypothetical protein OEZ86_002155 [Tetradesmus obliquus]